jgi:hypothetical protein
MTEKSIFRLLTSAKKNPEKLPLSSRPAVSGATLDLIKHKISFSGSSYGKQQVTAQVFRLKAED